MEMQYAGKMMLRCYTGRKTKHWFLQHSSWFFSADWVLFDLRNTWEMDFSNTLIFWPNKIREKRKKLKLDTRVFQHCKRLTSEYWHQCNYFPIQHIVSSSQKGWTIFHFSWLFIILIQFPLNFIALLILPR